MTTITKEDKETLIREVMKNYPEYSGGNSIKCTHYDYKNCRYCFTDEETMKPYHLGLKELLKGFDILLVEVVKGKIYLFDTGAIMDGGNWDATAVDALVQYAIFGEVRYG